MIYTFRSKIVYTILIIKNICNDNRNYFKTQKLIKYNFIKNLSLIIKVQNLTEDIFY